MRRPPAARGHRVAASAARPLDGIPGAQVILVSSSGGHLLLLNQLKPWWERHRRLWVTFDAADGRSLLENERIVWAHHPTTRNVKNLIRNLWLAWRVIRSTRPSVVVSTGAGVAVPFFVVAKIFGSRTVYVEAVERIDSPSLSGRLCYPLSDAFILQWEAQRRHYPRGHVVGPLY